MNLRGYTTRAYRLAGLILLLASTNLLHAQGPDLEVRPADREQFTQEPREIVAVAFIVRNATGRPLDLEARLLLPPGWRPITPEFPFSLAPGQTAVRLVSFMIPETAREGEYAVTYEVRDRQQPAVRDAYSVRVGVLASPKVQVLPLEVPDLVVAGESYQATFLVRNTGNAPIEAGFKARAVHGGEPDPRTGTVKLEPGESRSIAIKVATPELRRRTGEHLRLTVAVPGTPISAGASAITQVVPRVTAEQAYHTMPAQLGLSYVARDANDTRTSGWQAELSGAGTLDEENTRSLSFMLRGPDVRPEGAFGTFDEYWLHYRDETTSATLGDHLYALSPLTEFARYGRGARLGYEKQSWGLSTYHVEDRFSTEHKEQTAFNTYYQVTPGTRVDVNLLDKEDALSGTVYSLRGQTLWAPGVTSDLEVAQSDGEGERGQAFRGSFYDSRSPWRYYAIGWRADPEYRGYVRDQEYLSAGFDYPREGRWGLRGYYRLQSNNLDARPERPAAKERQASLGTYRTLASATRVSLDYNVRTRADRRDAPAFDLTNHAVRLGLSQSFKDASMLYTVERGETEDQATGARFDTALHVLSGSWRASRTQSYSVYALRDDNAFSNEPQDAQTTLGLNANYNPWTATFVNFNAQRNRTQAGRNSTYHAGLVHRRRNGDRASFAARRIDGRLPQTDMLLTYTVPFDLPVARKAGISTVRGRVYDAETGAGLRNVVLNLDGMTAVSGENGRFTFPAVKAGSYRLSIDRSNIEVGKVPVGRMPLDLAVVADEPQDVEIGLIRSAVVNVQVNLYVEGTEMSRSTLARGAPNILVTLKNGERAYRRLTDAEGHIRLAGLPPGRWTASIATDTIPGGYEAENRELMLEARPGGIAGAEFPLTPVVREIKMLPPLEVK